MKVEHYPHLDEAPRDGNFQPIAVTAESEEDGAICYLTHFDPENPNWEGPTASLYLLLGPARHRVLLGLIVVQDPVNDSVCDAGWRWELFGGHERVFPFHDLERLPVVKEVAARAQWIAHELAEQRGT